MKPSEVTAQCRHLLEELPRFRAQLSDSATQHEFLQMAALAFWVSCHLPLSGEDTQFFEQQRVEHNPELGQKWQSYYWGLALGYFLGKFRCGEINQLELDYILAVVPGFMFLHSPSLCGV